MAATLPSHKVKKGETLSAIAKKYKHPDWKVIWNAPENKQVKSKRKEPEKIEPGDELVIPLTAKEQKEQDAQIEALETMQTAETGLLEALESESERLDKMIAVQDSLIKSSADTTKQIVAELQKNLKGMKNWAEGVDTAAMLLQMGVGLAKLCGTGFKASKATGEALEKLNAQALKESSEIRNGVLSNYGAKAAGKLKDDDRWYIAVPAILADSFDKMTSPSFWSNTYIKLSEGKSWSDAVTSDIGDEIEQQIKDVQDRGAEYAKKLSQAKEAMLKRQAELDKSAKETEERLKGYEKQLEKLED